MARLDTALDEAEREAIEAEIVRADQSRREDARVHLPLVARARVASPCAERWDAMLGDGAVRSCARCDSEVFDLGLMTLATAERFVRSRIGAQSCVRLHRRADGTMLFADCEVGARGVRRRTQGLAVAAVAIGAASAAVMAAPPPRAPLVLPASPQQPITAPSAMFALPGGTARLGR